MTRMNWNKVFRRPAADVAQGPAYHSPIANRLGRSAGATRELRC
jgi:hypothetical protein